MSATRRLAAILAADVAGYSRLVGADEEGTVARLRDIRKDLVDPTVAAHSGRIVKTSGDGMLVEFASVVDAVRCALEVQRGMVERNAGISSEMQIRFRVGINLGDVIVEPDGDLMGDGVNVAARLEGIAQPGGICLSRSACEQVKGRIDVTMQDLGDRRLKNIAEPVRIFRIDAATPGGTPRTRTLSHLRRRAGIALGFLILVALVGAGAWYVTRGAVSTPTASTAGPATPAARLSLVVLPFTNLSGDASQDYLADVLTEELTTSLSRLPDSFVVSRTTAFTYRGKAVDVKQIGKDLGVRFALEGSAQKSGARVRVNAQLIDTESGAHLWADQFDEDRSDLLQMQDEIVARLARALQIQLSAVEAGRAARRHAAIPDAEDLAMQCEAPFLRYGPFRKEMQAAYDRCEQALKIDPGNVRALTILANRFLSRVSGHQSPNPRAEIRKADDLVSRALANDPNDYLAHFTKAGVLVFDRPEEAAAEAEASLALNPSFIPAYSRLWAANWYGGHPQAAIGYVDTALRLSPRDPQAPGWIAMKGFCYFSLRRYDQAADALRRSLALVPDNPIAQAHLAAALELSGHGTEARETLQRYLSLPLTASKTIAQLKAAEDSDRPFVVEHMNRVYAGLRKAGMPEE